MRRERRPVLGATVTLDMADEDHLYWGERDFAEGPALALLAGRAIAPPGRVLVAGAGTGLLALGLAASFPGARIEAVEHRPDLWPLLEANVAASGFADRIACRRGLVAGPGVPAPLFVRSRDQPEYRRLVAPDAFASWMERLDCPEVRPEGRFDVVIVTLPEVFPAAAALVRRSGAAGFVARVAELPGREERRALAAACPHVFLDAGASGAVATPPGPRGTGPLLDIVVPVWGVEKHVVACVGSLLAEPDPAIRVVVVDDGSPDASVARLRAAFGPDSARFVILPKANGGCASARNHGLGAGVSPWVAFADGDDAVEPGFFSGLLRAAELSGLDIVQGGFAIWREPDAPEASYEAEVFAAQPRGQEGGGPSFRLPAATLLSGQPAIWRRVYRRDFLMAHGFAFPEHVRAFDDQLFQLRTLAATDEVLMLDGPRYLYRQHEGQDVAQADERHFASLGMFRTALAEALDRGRPDLASLLEAMCLTMNWSARKLREDLRPAFVAGAGELLALFAKAAGTEFPEAALARLDEGEVRAEFEAGRRRLAGEPPGPHWAALRSLSFEPGLARFSLRRPPI